MQENILESQIDEVDTDGGWLITHHTRTWDTRVRLDSIETQIAEKQAAVEKAQQELEEVQAKVQTFAPEIQAFSMKVDAPTIATSTPNKM